MITWSQPMPVLAVGDGRRVGRAQRQRLRARVEHDEVVAEPVHLAKSYGRGVGHFTETV